jgi:hypothetical protein
MCATMIQSILANLPNWIQAVAAAGIAILTLLTLLVLKRYAADTKTIASASVTQIENSQMPFLALAMSYSIQNQPAGWVLENQGPGPAINVKFVQLEGGKGVRSIPPIGPEKMCELYPEIGNAAGEKAPMQIDYESLSGSSCRTVITWEGALMRTQFYNLEQQKSAGERG